MPANLENLAVATSEKGQFLFQSQRKAMLKKCSSYCTIALISHATKVMLKILQANIQQFVNGELPDNHA